MDERTLRRHGICRGAPAKRRNLALILPKACTEQVLAELVRQAGLQVGVEAAPDRATSWLLDGTWRERWQQHQEHLAKAEAAAMPEHRLRGIVACRVLGDRAPIERVAAELGLPRDQVLAIVAAAAEARGMPERELQQLLGIAAR